MTVFQTIAFLLTVAAAGAYVNLRFLKLPATIGMMGFAMLLSCTGIIVDHFSNGALKGATAFIAQIDFSDILLHGLLSFLLFAGALNINLSDLKRHGAIVAVLATVSVAVACFITGSIVWCAAQWFGLSLSYIDALLFGSLIAPTDPVAVMGILRDTAMSKELRVKIGGESLLNDGVGIVLFLGILSFARDPGASVEPYQLGFLMLWEGVCGVLLGLSLGWLGWQILRSIDDYKVEVLVTLAVAAGGYCIAEFARVSAPIAMVAAGLVIGNHGRILGMSSHTRRHVDMFWELIDEILNAVLFLLMGLEMIVLKISPEHIPLGLATIGAVLLGRWISVVVPITAMNKKYGFGKGTTTLLTWGGLRGGISIALALSLPPLADKNLILTLTYMTVVFSVLIQGTTFRPLARALVRK